MAKRLERYGGQGRGRAGRGTPVFPYLVLGAIIVLVAVASFAAMNEQQRAAGSTPLPSAGRLTQAPDFTFTLFDGKELTLSTLRGKPVVLNFWASWCPPCREEARGLQRVYEAYRERDVVFLGVDFQDTDENGRAFLKEFGITYPNGRDVTGKIASSYGVTAVPETFLITREGRIVRHVIGPITEQQLSGLIQQSLLP